ARSRPAARSPGCPVARPRLTSRGRRLQMGILPFWQMGSVPFSPFPESVVSDPAKTVFAFGWYILVLGAALVLAPNLVLTSFGLPPTGEVWIRVVGMLLLFIAG